jgi:hypothetical protein
VKNTRPPSKPDFSSSFLRQVRPRLRAPGAGGEAKALRLGADRRNHPGMLVAEVAALGEAAHVEVFAPLRVAEARAGAADHGRRLPFRLHAPAVQHRVALVALHRSPPVVR